ncbi:uncharacterized protein [Antedon mediterranea]|uniref:uncharacterized protein isoform X2 n=1 Tax=Antedon mediterranea TaxID=105859 RepID=UPI003AF5538F
MTSKSERNLFVKTYSRKTVRIWKDDKFVPTGLKTTNPVQQVKRPRFLRSRMYPEAWSDDDRFISLSQRKAKHARPLKNISNDEPTLKVAGKRIGSPFHKKKGAMSVSRGHLKLIEESEPECQDLIDNKDAHAAHLSSIQCPEAVQLPQLTNTPAVSECSIVNLLDNNTSGQSSDDVSSLTDSMETIADDLTTTDLDTSSTQTCLEDSDDSDEDTTLCCTDSTMTYKTAYDEKEETFLDMETLRHDLPDYAADIARPLEPVQFSFLHKITPISFTAKKAKGLLPVIKVSKVIPKKRPSVGRFTGMNQANSTLQKKTTALAIHDYQSVGDLSDIPVDNNLEGHWNAWTDKNLHSTPVENSEISKVRTQPDLSSITGGIEHLYNLQGVVSSMDASSIKGAPTQGGADTQGCTDTQGGVGTRQGDHTRHTKRPRSVFSFTTSEESSDASYHSEKSVLQIHGKRLLSAAKVNKSPSKSSSIKSSKHVSFSLCDNKKREYEPELSIQAAQLHLPSISPSSSILKKRSTSMVDKSIVNDGANIKTSTPIRKKRHRSHRSSMMKYSFDVSAVELPACDERELILQDNYESEVMEITPTKTTAKEVTPQIQKLSGGIPSENDLQTLMIKGETTPLMRVKRALSNAVVPTLPKNKKSRKTPNDLNEDHPTVAVSSNRKLFNAQTVVPQCCIEKFNEYSYLPAGKFVQYKSSIKFDQNIPEGK